MRCIPIVFTSHSSSGKWVNVTTLPALWVGWQLYDVGGYRLALLVPMAGSLAAAFAGLALLRRLGVRSEGWAWTGFFVLALASPLTIYALDFWEHSLGVALMAWAVVVLVDVVGVRRRPLVGAVLAGGLLGASATMRTESLVYLGVVGIVVVLLLARVGAGAPAKRGAAAVAVGVALLVGAAVPVVANEILEREVVGGGVRSSRIAGTVREAGDLPADRLEEAGMTVVGLEGSPQGIALGAGFVAVLAFAVLRRDTAASLLAVAGAAGIGAVRAVASGFGFVPGVLPAWGAPAVAGVASALPGVRFEGEAVGAGDSMPSNRRAATVVLAVALGAIPIVLVTQFRGGAGPQWAGRYLLVSGFLLAVVGLAALDRRPTILRTGVIVLAVAVTAFGLAWLRHPVPRRRPHDPGAGGETGAGPRLRRVPPGPGGRRHLRRQALAHPHRRPPTMRPTAADVLTDAGVTTFAAVEPVDAPPDRLDFPGFEPADRTTLRLFDGVDLRITRWEAAP